MLNRLAIVIYLFLHIPLLLIPIYLIDQSDFNLKDINTYRARCTSNNQLVVLQGTTNGSAYTFSQGIYDDPRSETDNDLRFYCSNYDQVQKHIEEYKLANTREEQIEANKAFFKFQQTVPTTLNNNYNLEIVSTDNYSTPISTFLLQIVLSISGYYVFLQLVRIMYQFIGFGYFSWKPYDFTLSHSMQSKNKKS